MTKYSADISKETLKQNFRRIIGQIYKLLPYREEGLDWEKPLETIQIELAGMDNLFLEEAKFHRTLFSLECKLEGLLFCGGEEDFEKFRRTIFECISKVKDLEDIVCQD